MMTDFDLIAVAPSGERLSLGVLGRREDAARLARIFRDELGDEFAELIIEEVAEVCEHCGRELANQEGANDDQEPVRQRA